MVKPSESAASRRALGHLAGRLGAQAGTLDYLANPDPARRIVYIETPKVACTAIKAYMQDRAAPPPGGTPEGRDVHDRASSPLPMLSSLPPATRRAALAGSWRRFSFTRNPFARLLSGYLDKIVTNDWERARHLPQLGFAPDARIPLGTFLKALAAIPEEARDIHFAPQSRLLCLGDIGYDFLGAFERFEADFAEMKRRFYGESGGGSYAVIGKRHATGAADRLAEHFGPAETALARQLYAADFALLGYSGRLEDAALPPARTAPPGRSAEIAARRLGLPSPGSDPAGFAAAVDAGGFPALRRDELLRRAAA
ncbi:sulfotransferase family protein [Poseidonocella sp. HB161398]|uniref:sulfotransferase family protein n=1 Tax=Poseidonocella sp. HB161398 TaxID=2320855 RepID=UPI001107C8CD|nr:sulfotransferase family protein [Poseidonocella sp. HB161398]